MNRKKNSNFSVIIGLFFWLPHTVQATSSIEKVSSPRAVIEAVRRDVLDGNADSREIVVFLDLDLFLGTYRDPFLAEFFYKLHEGIIHKRKHHEVPGFLVEEFRKEFHLPEDRFVTDFRLNALIFCYLRLAEKFVLAHDDFDIELNYLIGLGVDVKILTARYASASRELTQADLVSSKLGNALSIKDVLFVGNRNKVDVAVEYMEENDKKYVYFGDDVERYILPFKNHPKMPNFKGFHLDLDLMQWKKLFAGMHHDDVKHNHPVDKNHEHFMIHLFREKHAAVEKMTGKNWVMFVDDFYLREPDLDLGAP